MTTLDRDQVNARLAGGHYLDERSDGSVVVMMRDERVPAVFFAEPAAKGLIEWVKGKLFPPDYNWRVQQLARRVPAGFGNRFAAVRASGRKGQKHRLPRYVTDSGTPLNTLSCSSSTARSRRLRRAASHLGGYSPERVRGLSCSVQAGRDDDKTV